MPDTNWGISIRRRLQAQARDESETVSPCDRYVYCEIVCTWLTGTIQARYVFQARITTRPSRLRIVARSPIFFASEPIEPTFEARDALTVLTGELLRGGWEAIGTGSAGHWYSRAFRRERRERRQHAA